ncbi:MAG: hypothetical protein ACRENL_11855 [Candidatus Dormibacteria bacterium]
MPAPGSSRLTWLIAASALTRLRSLDAQSPLAARFFDNAGTDVLVGPRAAGIPSGWRSVPTAGFRSYADLASAIAAGTLDASITTVLYDPEAWQFTPIAEQRDPGRYAQLAADLCRSHHLRLIVTPAVDLTQVLSPGAADARSAFLSLGIAGQAARAGDTVVIQAQRYEADTAQYRAFVVQAAAQARAANPGVTVLAGLSTGPGGKPVNAGDLYSAYQATRDSVQGYWLNIPAQGADCPTCTQPRPDVAAGFLQMVSR